MPVVRCDFEQSGGQAEGEIHDGSFEVFHDGKGRLVCSRKKEERKNGLSLPQYSF